jgi:DNA replication and repair protein RecF
MIQSVRLQNYRSYDDASFEFEPGVNIIVGPNACGKTNLIESIMLGVHGSSYRAHDADLIKHSTEWARIDMTCDAHERSVKLQVKGAKVQTRFVLDGVEKPSLTYHQTIPVVVFEPNHLLLLTQSPELRRQYLDDTISQLNPEYKTWLTTYRRALAQRNNLLKQTGVSDDMFFVWEVRLSQLANQLVNARYDFVTKATPRLRALYKTLASTNHTADLEYSSIVPIANYGEVLLRELAARRKKDMLRGFTTLGPHRDDLVVQIDGHNISLVASRGEARTIVLALKLIELESIELARDQKPIVLLDDVFSELDGARRKNLTKHLETHQSFITTTDADIVTHHFATNCHVIALS